MARVQIGLGSPSTQITTTTKDPKQIAKIQGAGNLHERIKAQSASTEPVLLVFDVSGSMSWSFDNSMTRIEAAKTCIGHLLDASKPGKTRYGLISFSSIAVLRQPMTTAFSAVRTAANAMKDDSSTAMHSGISMALGCEGVKRLILVSDGEPDREEEAWAEVENAAVREIPIDCIFIGEEDSHGAVFMRRIAEKTGGLFYTVKDMAKFKKAIVELETENRLQITDQRKSK